jgi:hypothetical protein
MDDFLLRYTVEKDEYRALYNAVSGRRARVTVVVFLIAAFVIAQAPQAERVTRA